jgi:hypothetical protein
VLFFVLPTISTLISRGWLEKAGRCLDTTQTFRYMIEADRRGHGGPILASIGFWIVLPLALGVLRTVRREVA